jgi:dolichol-phosphate mannosyltransferase
MAVHTQRPGDAAALAPAGAVPHPETWAKRPGLVSLVVPVYREEKGIGHFCEAVIRVMDDLGQPCEIIFVEDDSPDRSLEMIRQLHRRYPGVVRALSMSRRFGHQVSLAAGFEAAAGDVVVCMDSDMQHPPEMLPLLLWKWSQGYQLVYTRRRKQQGRGLLKEQASRLFYAAINRLSEIRFEDGTADFRLMDRVVVDALRRFSERWIFYRGLVQWAGFRRTAVVYDAPDRFAGTSSYTWSRMLRMGLDTVFAFSLVPLRFSYVVGTASLAATLAYAAWTMLVWLRDGSAVPGYTSLVLLVSFLGSLHLICLGIVGEYVGRVHEQVKNRPLYLVKERIGLPGPGTEDAGRKAEAPRAA